MKITITNEELKKALKDKQTILESALQESELDDEQLEMITKYKQLEPLEQDLFFLRSQYKIREIAEMYNVSGGYISMLLKQINEKMR